MNLSIIVPWRDRPELQETLPTFRRVAQAIKGEVILVNYGANLQELSLLVGGGFPELRVLHVSGQEYFNKSSALNIGASRAGSEVFFFCDCDILLEEHVVSRILVELSAQAAAFATVAGVRETEVNARQANHVTSFGYELMIRTKDGRQVHIKDNEEDAEDGTRQAPGLLFVKRSHFMAVEGYNSKLHGWGWEDQDMICRLTLGLALTRINHGNLMHISHGDDARLACYPPTSSRWESRDRMFRTALANYDRANFAGTYTEDTQSLQPYVCELQQL